MMPARAVVSRRHVLAGTGALVFAFSSVPRLFGQESRDAQNLGKEPNQAASLPGSLKQSPFFDSWIRIDADGAITVFTGKAELGQGIKTALLQIAAEELDVPLRSLTLVTADTERTVNEGYTAGSRSLQDSGTAIRHAAAQIRDLLVAEAAKRLAVPLDQLNTETGFVVARDGRRLGYGEIVSAELLHAAAQPTSPLKDYRSFKLMAHPVPRVDIPAKVTGGAAFVQDLRFPGMLHARVVRPPSYGARLLSVDVAAIERMPGVVKVIRDGDFLAVVSEREFQAIKGMRKLARAARWDEKARLPRNDDLPSALMQLRARDFVVHDQHADIRAAQKTLTATYARPYQAHASIGPSCAVAKADAAGLTVWTHTQGVYPDRQAIAEMLRMPVEQVHCIHVEGSGCYGHNGADDAAGDAALIARALPGRPIRVQWSREQEHGWEPYGPAMVAKISASLDGGDVVEWDYAVWSNTHSMRPGGAGALIAAQHLAEPFPPPAPKPLPQPEGGGDRNAIPLYKFPNARVVHHFLADMPVRVSALRGLGAYMNVFSIESFVDELAQAAGIDPVQFRLKHLDDERARKVVIQAAERFHWRRVPQLPPGRGQGFAFARYKNLAAYCAIAMEVEVARDTGRSRVLRAVAAVDAGQVVNPDGIANQIEGGILQSMSWTLYERVSFDDTRITSTDWSTYPILRFNAVPDQIEVHVIERPGDPFLGAGEAAQGPAAAALANAIASATGKRLRDLPLTRERIMAAIAE
jgi:CO/xanthine dehydrogenase Mo-binding subunit